MRAEVVVFVNGTKHTVSNTDPVTTLLEFLRDIGATGTKLVCGEGGCGACTVMVSRYDFARKQLRHLSVNACLTPLCAVDHCAITTIEGIGSPEVMLHPIQERIAAFHGSQCGFCTPGIVMAMYTFMRNHKHITEEDIEHNFDGNLCRCTGYRPILDAMKSFANKPGTELCAKGENCCRAKSANNSTSNSTTNSTSTSAVPRALRPYNADQDPIFPPWLMLHEPTAMKIEGLHATWYRPTTLDDLLAFKHSHPTAKLIVGNTEVGIETRLKNLRYPTLVHTAFIPELLGFAVDGTANTFTVGASVTLNDLALHLRHATASGAISAAQRSTVTAFLHQLRWFAGTQIRNVGCVGGNIVTASPISDLNPLFVATGATFILQSKARGSREVKATEFFVGYRKTLLQPDEVLVAVRVPLTAENEFFISYKQARRREDDISIVCAGIRATFAPLPAASGEKREFAITALTMGFGGMAPTTVDTPKVSEFVANACKSQTQLPWNMTTLAEIMHLLKADLPLSDSAPGGQILYRRSLTTSFLLKFFIETQARLRGAEVPTDIDHLLENTDDIFSSSSSSTGATAGHGNHHKHHGHAHHGHNHHGGSCTTSAVASDTSTLPSTSSSSSSSSAACCSSADTQHRHLQPPIDAKLRAALEEAGIPLSYASAIVPIQREISHGRQDMGDPVPTPGQIVGESVTHVAADLQASGVAAYTDDIPVPRGTLYAAPVLSIRAHAKIVAIDASGATGMPGVKGFFSRKDVKGDNIFGAIFHDEEVFASTKCVFHSALIGIVVAETALQAREAAKHVTVEYDELPAILSIEDAIAANSFFTFLEGTDNHTIVRGDPDTIFSGKDTHLTVLEGTVSMGGQEHFYLEPHGALVVPGEGGECTVFSSTQNPTEVQHDVASTLGVSSSRVVVRAKRIGGGFGGKETRSGIVASAAAVAAQHLRRPVKFILERQVDMAVSGGRHPFMCKYKVAVDPASAKIHALHIELFSNAGHSFDLSGPVMDRALFHVDNSYLIPNLKAIGKVCKTNLPSNTAFRGFGGPQGMFCIESAVDHIARHFNRSPLEVRQVNMYKEGDMTHYNQQLTQCNMERCWNQALEESEFARRRAAVDAFNSEHRFRKRGLYAVPTKFGMSFTAQFMNKASALVHVYTDGTVLVSHGGIEMGQGLHTKMIQVAAHAFGIPVSQVHIAETATDRCANTSPTAASVSSDLNGMAVLNACEQINERLAPLRAANPNDSFKDLATKAFFNRINLSANGFYATPDIGYVFGKGGRPFNYYVYGTSVAEVEIDTLTGDHQVIFANVVMDLGKPLNPAIDVGQIEGAFIQGYGLFCLEEHVYMPNGAMFTRGPGTYKIPSFNDVPMEFNISLLRGSENKRAIHSSKGVGEPPLFLGSSVLFALKDAVLAARKDDMREQAGNTQLQLTDRDAEFVMHSPCTSERIRMACTDNYTRMFKLAKEPAVSAPGEVPPFV